MDKKIKIIIADDHPVFRGGLNWAISADSSIEVVDEAENGTEALKCIKRHEPDIAVLDINMPEISGFEVIRELQNKNLATEVIILTAHDDEAMFNKALDLGVKGYLLKESAVEDIVEGIKAVSKGDSFINSTLSPFLFSRNNRNDNAAPTTNDLTPTQQKVLRLIAQEKTSREIAEILFISVRTVERHRENICAKLNLSGTNALFKFALANKNLII